VLRKLVLAPFAENSAVREDYEAVGDAVRGIRSNVFTLVDLKYTFMLQSFGLIRMSLLKEPVYRRPAYFAMQNVYSYFDDDMHPVRVLTKEVNGRTLTIAEYERQSAPVYVVWQSDRVPSDSLAYERIPRATVGELNGYVWVDLMTGRICELAGDEIPVWDSPVLLAPNNQVPRRTEWTKMKPAEIIDAIYRPNQGPKDRGGKRLPRKMSVTNEPWATMATKHFQIGWTDVCDRPYPETVKALREVGYPLYETRAAAKSR